MLENIKFLFSTGGSLPRWHCGLGWTNILGWTHICSDVVIFLSYVSIPISILHIASNIGIPEKKIATLFVAFILLCGIGHLIESIIFWHPIYRISAIVKVLTAIVSFITAVSLVKLLPKIVILYSNLSKMNLLELQTEQIPYAICFINKNHKIYHVNKAFYSLFGYVEGDLLSLTLSNIFTTSFVEKFLTTDISQYSNNQILSYKTYIFNKNKEQIYVEVALTYLNMEGENSFMLFINNIEHIKELEQSSKVLTTLFNNSIDGIITTNVDGMILSYNANAEKIFQYSAKEIIGKNINVLISSNMLDVSNCKRKIEAKRKDGSLVSITLLLDEVIIHGNKIHSAIIHDLTDRKILEQEREQLILALMESNTNLERFAYLASHDLQEPLRMVTNYATKIQAKYEDKLDEKGKSYIKFAVDGAKNMQLLISDLLSYSKLECEEEDLSEVDFNQIVESTIKNLEESIKKTDAKIIYENLPILKTNHIRMIRLFQNLIGNGIKYRKNNIKPIIKISAISNGKEWLFSIEDNGIGIKEEYFEKIFEAFKRLHNKNEYTGTGMGLAICKKIINLVGGKIWVESSYGKGSTFFFTIAKP